MSTHNLGVLEWIGTLGSLIFSMAPVLWLWRFDADNARYLSIFEAGEYVALFFALLAIWLRGVVVPTADATHARRTWPRGSSSCRGQPRRC